MFRKLLFTGVFAPLLAACAAFPSAAQEVTPQQNAAIEATCTKVMRLHKGQSEFEACVSSLSDSVASLVSADYAFNAYQACGAQGLKRETSEFSRCVLNQEDKQKDAGRLPAGSAAKLNAAYIVPADSDPDDYFETSNKMRHRREQYACGGLGLEPDTSAFVACVNNLDMNIFTTEHPNG
ncbi:MAG TPA: hypothetical protein VGM68_11275 [Rhizomicrobium sp.]|jgi:hypothetical protein